MRTLGIDPGTATMGWGIVEDDGQGGQRLVAYGALITPKGQPLEKRLQTLYDGLHALIRQYKPDSAGIEELFFAKNVSTAMMVAHARGVAMLALAHSDIPLAEFRPMAVKQAMTGYGHADKRQMQEMVRLQLGLDTIPRPDDAADALAIALCQAHSARVRARYSE
ncbi:MAG: crossover junction endodeoxyribonuclease RuvC [Herpetosiphon sp.]